MHIYQRAQHVHQAIENDNFLIRILQQLPLDRKHRGKDFELV